MVEKPKVEDAPSDLSLTGKYIFEPEIFEYIKKTKEGAGGEIQITDAMKTMLLDYSVYGYKIDGERFDCGSVIGYLKANIAFALANESTKESTQNLIKDFYNKIIK